MRVPGWVFVAATVGLTLASTLDDYPKADFNDHNIVYYNQQGSWVKVPPTYPDGVRPMPIAEDLDWARNDATITILIASFRESRCPKTMKDLFDKAKNPSRIRIGVVQQNAKEDEDCLAGLCKLEGTPIAADGLTNTGGCKYFDQVRMIRMDAEQARGPVYARAQQIHAIEPSDDFCMQIDAHTDAVQDWDVRIIEQWYETENEYAVITAYPTNVDDLYKNSNNHNEMPYNCRASFSGNGKVRNAQANACANMDTPLLQPLWAAGLSFARCHAEWTVPQDPELKSVFTGEEFSRASRLWTAGYDFYALRRPVIGTYYGGAKGGHGMWHMHGDEATRSDNRMATLLKWPGSDQSADAIQELGIYGLGDKRTLEQYIEFSGVDTINQKMDAKCIVQYTAWPWDKHPTPMQKAIEMQERLGRKAKPSPKKQDGKRVVDHNQYDEDNKEAVVDSQHTGGDHRPWEIRKHTASQTAAGVVAILVLIYVVSGVTQRSSSSHVDKGRLEL